MVLGFSVIALLSGCSKPVVPGYFAGGNTALNSANAPGVVRTPSPIYRDGKDLILIKTIDGKSPIMAGSRTALPPGKHEFQVYVELHSRSASGILDGVTHGGGFLKFNVAPGHNYLIDAAEDQNGVQIWAIDETSKTIVAGHPAEGRDNRTP